MDCLGLYILDMYHQNPQNSQILRALLTPLFFVHWFLGTSRIQEIQKGAVS